MRLLLNIFLVAVLFIKVTPANAVVGINPHYILLDANSNKRNKQVIVSNTSNETKSYRMRFVNYNQLSDGSYEEILKPSKNAMFAGPHMIVSPNQTTLEPGQSQIIRLQRKPMLNAKDGEYMSRLMVQEVDRTDHRKKADKISGVKIEAKALYSVTIPIIIRKGDLSASGEVINPKVIKKEGKTVLTGEIKRSGTESLFVNVVVKNAKGKIIGRLNKLRVYMTTPKLTFDIPLDKYKQGENLIIELLDAETEKEISETNMS